MVIDESAHRPVYTKGADDVTPIASLTKLMTAIVTLDAQLPLDEAIAIDIDDFDYLKGTRSRLRMGATLSRREMLRLALMSSENRAASSLARNYPGGTTAFVAAMNDKGARARHDANELRRSDRTLRAQRVDRERSRHAGRAPPPSIRRSANSPRRRAITSKCSPRDKSSASTTRTGSSQNADWNIHLSKTGYIREAGKCLVMLATIASKPFVIVLLDSAGKYTRLGDAQRVRHWLETGQALGADRSAQGHVEAREGQDRRVQGSAEAQTRGPGQIGISLQTDPPRLTLPPHIDGRPGQPARPFSMGASVLCNWLRVGAGWFGRCETGCASERAGSLPLLW